MPDTDDLAVARWQLATLTGRLRCVEDERDAAVRDRDRTHDLVRKLRRSRSYRIGRVLTDLARDPVRIGPALVCRAARRVRRPTPAPVRKQRRVVPPTPARVYVAVGLSRTASQDLVRALRQRIVVDGDHLPVVVTDQPALRGLQVPGVVLEYLPDPETWSRHDPGEDWETLLAGRVAQLCRDHGANRAVVVDPRDPPNLARLL
ncbi:hypothetical protein ACIA5C_14930 [Actinoplanes sp. NPDC051343]|uniref:hypothetical protein n=1 Tax=Actinoplanes sp. NPDC051343 TaxID=3363906 RepID=UPI0037A342D2